MGQLTSPRASLGTDDFRYLWDQTHFHPRSAALGSHYAIQSSPRWIVQIRQ